MQVLSFYCILQHKPTDLNLLLLLLSLLLLFMSPLEDHSQCVTLTYQVKLEFRVPSPIFCFRLLYRSLKRQKKRLFLQKIKLSRVPDQNT